MAEIELTDNQKIQLLQENSKIKARWSVLDRESKQEVLEGMDIAVDEKWIFGLLEDAEDK